MSELLPPAVQKFVADAEGYLAGLAPAIEETNTFADRLDKAALEARKMAVSAAASAAAAAEAERLAADAAGKLADAQAKATVAQRAADEAAEKVEKGELKAAAATKLAAAAAKANAKAAMEEAAAEHLAADAARALERAQLGAAAAQMAVARARAANPIRTVEGALNEGKKPAAPPKFDPSIFQKVMGAGGGLGAFGPAAIIGVVGALPTLIGAATVAIGGLETAAMALPGAIGIGGAALVTLKMAISGVGDAISAGWSGNEKEFEKSLRGLAPAAQTAVRSIVNMKSEVEGIKRVVQQNFFAPFADQIGEIGRIYLPLARQGLGQMATALGRVGDQIAQFMLNSDSVKEIKGIFSGAASVVNKLAPAVGAIADAFSRLGNSSIKNFFGPLASGAAKAAEKFDDWVKKAEKSGQLKDMFSNLLAYIHAFTGPLEKLASGIAKAFGGKDSANGAKGLSAALNKLVDDIVPKLPTFVKAFSAAMRAFNDIMPAVGLVLDLVAALGKLQSWAMGSLWPSIGKGLKSLGDIGKDIGHFFSGPFLTPFKAVGDFFSGPFLTPFKAIGSFFSGPFLTPFKAIGDFFSGPFLTPFKAIGSFFTSTLPHWFQTAVSFVEGIPGKIGAALSSLPGTIRGAVQGGLHQVAYDIGYAAGTIVRVALSIPKKISTAFSHMWSDATSATARGYHAVLAWWNRLPGQISREASAIWGRVTSAFSRGWHSLTTATSNGYHAVVNWWHRLPTELAVAAANAWRSVTSAFSNGYHAVINWVSRTKNKIVSGFSEALSSAENWVSSGINRIISYWEKVPGRVGNALSSVPGKIRSAISSAIGMAETVGENIVRGLIRGLGSMVGGLISEARSLAGSVVKGFKDALHIGSPSRLMADEVGAMIPAGIAQGIHGNLSGVLASAKSMAQQVVRAAQVPPIRMSAAGFGRMALAGGGAGTTVNVNVAGSVVAESALRRTVQKQTLRYNARNPTNGLALSGRGRS